MSITDWPADERPREKLLHRGPHFLSDAELLAVFLRTGTTRKTAVDIGRDLIGRFGSLRNLLESDAASVMAQEGIGPAKYALLIASLELGRRHLEQTLTAGDLLTSPGMVRDAYGQLLAKFAQPKFGSRAYFIFFAQPNVACIHKKGTFQNF